MVAYRCARSFICVSVCIVMLFSGCGNSSSAPSPIPETISSSTVSSSVSSLPSSSKEASASVSESPSSSSDIPPPSGNEKDEPLAPDPLIYDGGLFIRVDTPTPVPRWEERTIAEQYTEAVWKGNIYTLSAGKIDDSLIQAHIGTVSVLGADYHNDTLHTASADAYSLKSISPHAAFAIKHKGYAGYFPFTANEYTPAILGDLIDDLNLRENLVFNDITYSYLENQTQIYEYYQLPDAAIWDLLLSNPSLKNEGDAHYTKPGMRIPIDVKVIGSKNISLAVNDTGYLQTNILGSAKTFFIGQERVQAFVDYVRSSGNKLEPPTQADLSVPESDRPVYPN